MITTIPNRGKITIGLAVFLLIPAIGCTEQSRKYTKARFGGRESKREYGIWLYSHDREREIPEAIEWITKAAKAGDTSAMYRLASIISAGGDGWDPNPAAVEWFRKGSEAGDRFCMIKLANAYEYGYLGLSIDHREANKWFEAARKAKKPGEM
jgi:TPR repeat protein